MKIKELYLRNIASIEKADINFENEIVDMVTGQPASIFLIAGDTGAGKSVILDGIALALYKKTPRIVGVANKTENKFTDNRGQAINVNSIEQYTRLGISEKDECYSELVFEGNDHREYRAKLELGMSKGKKNQDGVSLLKYKNPNWTVKVGDEDWIKVEAKTGQPILDAVGLTFEQFGRMAMLAQGQFASFLTGEKKERESILEQLTNTEKFSQYGAAISNLFKKAKSEKDQAQQRVDTEKEHTLDPAELQGLNEQMAALLQQKKQLDETLQKASERYNLVERVEGVQKDRDTAVQKQQDIAALQEQDEYKKAAKLVADWDATTEERRLLDEKQKANMRMMVANQQLEAARGEFMTLSADLAFREADIAQKKRDIAALEAWVDERKRLDALFTQEQARTLQLEQYQAKQKELSQTKESLATEMAKTEGLKQTWDDCIKKASDTKEAVDAKQGEIEQKTKQRESLNPTETNLRIKQLTEQNLNLVKLNKQIEQYQAKRTQIAKGKEEIEQEEKTLSKLKEVYDQTQKVFDENNKAKEKVHDYLSTMQMSLDQRLTELRRRLEQEHAEICPLCGQTIDWQHLKHDFSDILTPLQEQEQKAQEELQKATKERDEAQKTYNTQNGALANKKESLKNSFDEFEKEKNQIVVDVKRLNLEMTEELPSQLSSLIEEATQSLEALEKRQQQAESLQKEIAKLMDEKKPLDTAYNKAMQAQQDAKSAWELNDQKIKSLTQQIEKVAGEIDGLDNTLSPLLSDEYPSWKTETSKVIVSYKADAEDYCTKKEKVNNDTAAIRQEEESLNTAKGIKSELVGQHLDWNQQVSPTLCPMKELNKAWIDLRTAISHNEQLRQDAAKVVEANTQTLGDYYQQSGNTEEALVAMLNAGQKVMEARKKVTETETDLKQSQYNITKADKALTELMGKLQIEKMDDMPEKESLQSEKERLAEESEQKAKVMGSIDEKLKQNDANTMQLNEAKAALEKATLVFRKWDRLNAIFGGGNFRTLVQTYILRPLLNNANIYLEKITDRYTLTCSEENEQLSILVLDRYNKNQIRSVTVLSGGERFMISLALSLALSSLNRQDMNVNILFIDEGFGTLDETNLNSVMSTLEKLQEIAGQTNRRVGIISHREELVERIPVKIQVKKKGEGRSIVEISK